MAEQFGQKSGMKTPVVESTGTGGGMKLFCGGVGEDTPDITNASRQIKKSELEACAKAGVNEITEVKIGFDGIVLANSKKHAPFALSEKEIWLALAKEVPVDGKLVPNPNTTWNQINPALPAEKIEVLGPPPTSGTRDAFVELVMDRACEEVPEVKALTDANAKKAACQTIREDGAYIDAGENDNLIVQKLEANPTALGIFGYSFLDQNIDKLQGSTIQGVAPTFENIADAKYPVARSLYFYVKNAHVGVVPGIRDYIAEFTSDAAIGEDGYLADKGLIPLPEDQIEAVRADGEPSSSRCRCSIGSQPQLPAGTRHVRHPSSPSCCSSRSRPISWPAGARCGGRRALSNCTPARATTPRTRPCWPPGRRWRCGRSGACWSRPCCATSCCAQLQPTSRAKPARGQLLHGAVRRIADGLPPGRRGDAGDAGGRRLLRQPADLQPARAAGRRCRAGGVLPVAGPCGMCSGVPRAQHGRALGHGGPVAGRRHLGRRPPRGSSSRCCSRSIRFFQKVPLTEFLFGLQWSPQTALRADQVGSSGRLRRGAAVRRHLPDHAIAMLVAAPIGLFSAIYLSRIRRAAVPRAGPSRCWRSWPASRPWSTASSRP